jgi:hypothetical protein
MKPVTEVVYSSMPLDESRNIFQCVLTKQSCSIVSALSAHFCIERVTGTTYFGLIVSRNQENKSMIRFPNEWQERTLYASLCVE